MIDTPSPEVHGLSKRHTGDGDDHAGSPARAATDGGRAPVSTEDSSLSQFPLSRRDLLLALTFGLAGAGAGAGVLASDGSEADGGEAGDAAGEEGEPAESSDDAAGGDSAVGTGSGPTNDAGA